MSGSSIDVIIDDKAVSDYLKKLEEKIGNLHVSLADIGESLLLSHEDRWDKQVSPDGQAWLPLSALTQELKPKNKDKILVLNGYLKNLQYQVTDKKLTLGTDKEYAAIHQFGGTIEPKKGTSLKISGKGKNVFVKSVTIPARPFLGISHDDEDNIIGILKQYFTD
ncbi:MAG: hypothetical protein RL368_1482 [Pseudomonadota bacterium]|jgi:phage virion morphogenesis protein